MVLAGVCDHDAPELLLCGDDDATELLLLLLLCDDDERQITGPDHTLIWSHLATFSHLVVH